MHPILKAVSAITETWALPAVFELRKSTDDWADEEKFCSAVRERQDQPWVKKGWIWISII